ncbi:MAG TPA: PHP domain-containing protein [Anaerolineae bacterium]|nr:PHP domain-containing protein [Anaerolineae bacterium]HQH37449.1 PHP domain-containing protein [Anaerolineae bacterium]
MKIDLHVHTTERSLCADSSEQEQILTAIERGLDAIVITDHGRLVPPEHIEALNRQYAPFRIFGGVEITVQENEDVLVLGLHDPALEAGGWTYPTLHAFVRRHGGWLAIAHPFRYHPTLHIDLVQDLPDALEGCSTNIVLPNQPRIRELAEQLGIPVVCNSDAHITRSLGVGYNLLSEEPEDEAALVRILHRGAFSGVCTIT